ncbi:MAG TPA: hypothetical protein VFM06_06665 [Candidatus Limnocylindria bacterium]|nr:hypothetical protein [Candidatus Limnocylindria bacterium]
MTLNVVLPLLSSLVSFVFAALVLRQWLERRRSFQLIWAIGLLWYGISAGTEFWGSAFGWSEPLYRTWYLIGAFYVAAWLGMGTVALLARTRFGYFVAASLLLSGLITVAAGAKYQAPATSSLAALACGALAVATVVATWRRRELAAPIVGAALVGASLVAAALVLTAPIAAPGYALDHVTGVPVGEAMPAGIRPLTIPFNVGGALALVCGAIFSAYVYMPKHKVLRARALPPVAAQLYGSLAIVVNLLVSLPGALAALARGELHSRVPATLLIALGGFIPGLTSGLNRFGITWSFFLGELIGVGLIFAGFVVSTEVFSRATRVGPVAIGRSEAARTTS